MLHTRRRLEKIKQNFIDYLDMAIFPLQAWWELRRENSIISRLAFFVFCLFVNLFSIPLALSLMVFQLILSPFQLLYSEIKDLLQKHSPEENHQMLEEVGEPEEDLGLPKQWNEVLTYGRYAPSPHNMQPWVFQVESEDTVNLFYDPKRLLPGTNPTGSFMQVGFGILNETLSIAAASLGLEVNVEYIQTTLNPNVDGPQPLAKLKLVPRTVLEPLDRELIIKRQTSRFPYNGEPVKKELLDELVSIAEHYGHKFEYSSDPSQVEWVVRLNADTMFYDMSTELTRQEVSSWMRFSRGDAEKRADGLAAYTMNVSGFLMWFFVKANWMFRLPGIYTLVRHSYEKTMAGTATVSWISGPFETQKHWEDAGHMMARMWLTMTKHGVYLHPFGSVITNPQAHERMAEHFKNNDRQDDLWMLMRMGYGDPPPKAQRMPLAQMIMKGGGFFQTKASTVVRDNSANDDDIQPEGNALKIAQP